LIEEAIAPLLARIAQLEAQLAAAKKDSSTSSKPPSSDIVKPPRPGAKTGSGRKRKRRQGGQPGHPRHERPLFPPDQVNKIRCYEWTAASSLREWEPLDEYQTVQQVELLPNLFEMIEHRALRVSTIIERLLVTIIEGCWCAVPNGHTGGLFSGGGRVHELRHAGASGSTSLIRLNPKERQVAEATPGPAVLGESGKDLSEKNHP
jgi:hypothetical protein